jgi:hypothetical protein
MAIEWATEVGSLGFFKIFVIENLIGKWLFLSMTFDIEMY